MSSVTRPWASLGLIAALLLGTGAPAWAVDGIIRSIQFDPASRMLRINASAPVRGEMNILNIAGRKRIIVDINNAEIGMGLPRDSELTQQLSQNFPALRQLTTHQYGNASHPIVRILLEIDPAMDDQVDSIPGAGPGRAHSRKSGAQLPRHSAAPSNDSQRNPHLAPLAQRVKPCNHSRLFSSSQPSRRPSSF